jgi:hypothetical protein
MFVVAFENVHLYVNENDAILKMFSYIIVNLWIQAYMTHYTKLKSYTIFIVVSFENVHLYVNENDFILKMFSYIIVNLWVNIIWWIPNIGTDSVRNI